jgi:glutamate racemase
MNERPIGIFDSGVGGLTVVRSVMDCLPAERIIYLGDGARGPYGPRDIEEVRGFAHEIIQYLLGFGVKLIVIACNSATAAALEEAQQDYDIPVVGVIMPGVRGALERSKKGVIGVIGTKVTIGSGSYERALRRLDPGVRVCSQACPEFVEFVERGEVSGDLITETALNYVEPMLESGIDTLIMGCTHYPLLAPLLKTVVGPDVELISSADETASEVQVILDRLGWLADDERAGSMMFLTTGDAARSQELGRMFLGPEVRRVVPVRFEEHPEQDFIDFNGCEDG